MNGSLFMFGEILLKNLGIESKQQREQLMVDAYYKLNALANPPQQSTSSIQPWFKSKASSQN